MAKKGGLGRGLSAILEDVEQAYSKEIAHNFWVLVLYFFYYCFFIIFHIQYLFKIKTTLR